MNSIKTETDINTTLNQITSTLNQIKNTQIQIVTTLQKQDREIDQVFNYIQSNSDSIRIKKLKSSIHTHSNVNLQPTYTRLKLTREQILTLNQILTADPSKRKKEDILILCDRINIPRSIGYDAVKSQVNRICKTLSGPN
jgi:hypothetical protein